MRLETLVAEAAVEPLLELGQPRAELLRRATALEHREQAVGVHGARLHVGRAEAHRLVHDPDRVLERGAGARRGRDRDRAQRGVALERVPQHREPVDARRAQRDDQAVERAALERVERALAVPHPDHFERVPPEERDQRLGCIAVALDQEDGGFLALHRRPRGPG